MTTTTAPVDLDRLAAWMAEQGLLDGPLDQVEVMAGGTQNILLRIRLPERTLVLRHPPPHKRANSDETMRREARVLAALAATHVPHPRLVAACGDAEVLGAAFYLTEEVEGFNAAVEMPALHRDDPSVQRAMGFAMVDAIGAVARVDVEAVGLTGLGRPDGWLERQVERWRSQLASYRDVDGFGGERLPGVERVAHWLAENRPAVSHLSLIHGDFHFANVLIDQNGPAVAAIVDWELTTIGDPMLDLGHFLATLPTSLGERWLQATPSLAGMALPEPAELVAHYASVTNRDAQDVAWFEVLASYRLGIILEGTNARANAGRAPREIGDELHNRAVVLLARAGDLLDAS